MRPDQYKKYSKVFDYFSNPEFFPALKDFIQTIKRFLPAGAVVTDVGGGTGLYDQMLLEQVPGINLSVIEPAQEMMAIAQQRLGPQIHYYPHLLDQVLPTLPMQDAFIFQRSLYAIYKNRTHCEKLFLQLNQRLASNGFVFVYEFKEKINLQDMKRYLEGLHEPSMQGRFEWLEKMEIFEVAVKLFNEGIDNGEFHIFTADELDSLFGFAGFVKVYQGRFDYVYQKKKERRGSYWLYKAMDLIL